MIDGGRPFVDVLWQVTRGDQALDAPEARAGLKVAVEVRLAEIRDGAVRDAYHAAFGSKLREAVGLRLGKPGKADEGRGEARRRHDPDDPPDIDAVCPLTPLGVEDVAGGAVYVLLTESGRLVRVPHFQLGSPTGMMALFEGRDDWLRARFPLLRPDGSPSSACDGLAAARWLIRACHDEGLYDPHTRVRGLGVWRDGPRTVVHCGDGVWVDGAWHQPGLRLAGGRDIYVARPLIPRPLFTAPATAADVQALLSDLRLWHYASPCDAELVLGFHAQALLGGAPSWKVHVLVGAEHGSGKTGLARLTEAALGAQAGAAESYSEAGIRQALAGEGRAIVLEEAEDADGAKASAIQAVIGLIRRMSGLDGARVLRGTAGGTAQQTEVTGCAFLVAINPPRLLPQDRTRILDVALLKATGDPDAAERVEAAIVRAAALSPALRARAVIGRGRFEAAFGLYRSLVVERCGDGRLGDLFGTLLAGSDMLLHDHPPDPDSARDRVERIAGRIAEMASADKEDNDATSCFNHVLGQIADQWRRGELSTLGDLVMIAHHDGQAAGDARPALRRYGLMWLRAGEEGGPALVVANRHPQLDRLYTSTPWSDGRWGRSLRRLAPERCILTKTLNFAGVRTRGTLIPADLVPTWDESVRPEGEGL